MYNKDIFVLNLVFISYITNLKPLSHKQTLFEIKPTRGKKKKKNASQNSQSEFRQNYDFESMTYYYSQRCLSMITPFNGRIFISERVALCI